jgi:hypothetical protein
VNARWESSRELEFGVLGEGMAAEPLLERVSDERQVLERLRHAQLFLRGARLVTQ